MDSHEALIFSYECNFYSPGTHTFSFSPSLIIDNLYYTKELIQKTNAMNVFKGLILYRHFAVVHFLPNRKRRYVYYPYLGQKAARITGNICPDCKAPISWASQVAQLVMNLPASAGDTGDMCSIPGLERSPGVGNGNPLQYSCLENSMDRGA